MLSAAQIIKQLDLEPHVEGGFYRRTYQSEDSSSTPHDDDFRHKMTSIFYLLTSKSSIGCWHMNTSDIVHFYHAGDPIDYRLIAPDGTLSCVRMGNNVLNEEQLQLTVKGGVWKSSQLISGHAGYGLISEAVTPGFDYRDMTLGDREHLSSLFPQHIDVIKALSRK